MVLRWPELCRRGTTAFQGASGDGEDTGRCGVTRRTRGWPWRLRGRLGTTARHRTLPLLHGETPARSSSSNPCAKQRGKGLRGCARAWASERSKRGRRVLAPSPGNGGALPRPTPIPARDSDGERARFDGEQRGKRKRGSRVL